MRRRDVLGLGMSLLIPRPAWALGQVDQQWKDDFRYNFVEPKLRNTSTPGLGVAMIRDGQTVFAEGYGVMDTTNKKKVTQYTSFHIASVSKVVTGAAMMTLWEQKPDRAFEFDDPINTYLDFSVIHPQFQNIPITFRHLFTHTSGISDDGYNGFQGCNDPTLSLRDFLMGYLTQTRNQSFSQSEPGKNYEYSDVGIALLGYLAGLIHRKSEPKIPLEDLTQQTLFAPLGTTNTAWKIQDALKLGDVATPYYYDPNNGQFTSKCQTGYPDWPAGMLRSSPRDFARFLAIFTNNGVVDNKPYMADATVREFLTAKPGAPLTPSGKRQGLIWQIDKNSGVASHDGCDDGALTLVSVDPQNRTAALAFANFNGCGCEYCNNCNNCTNPVADFLTQAVDQLLKKARSLTP